VKSPSPPSLRGDSSAISYPANVAEIRSQDQSKAREIQRFNGDAFQKAFAQGLAVTHFQRTDSQGIYLLETWNEN
jgi:predicted GNAT superfamily acetyltransferase